MAVIPASIESSLAPALRELKHLRPCVHGWAHRNHAPPGEKKQELGAHRELAVVLAELEKGQAEVLDAAGGRELRVLVPPWNRIDQSVVERLPRHGFSGLSVFEDRYTDSPPAGLVVRNTHLDVIDWRGTRGCRPQPEMIRDLVDLVKAGSVVNRPIGILTHHLDHDEEVWEFLEKLGALVQSHPHAAWVSPEEIFAV